MKRSKFSEEQIVYALRQADSGTPVGDLCRQLGIAEQTLYARRRPPVLSSSYVWSPGVTVTDFLTKCLA